MIDDRSLNHLKNRLVPYPNNVEFFDGEFFRIRNGCQVELAVPAGLESMVVNTFRNNWKMEPQITNYPANDGIKAEGYLLSVNENRLRIEAGDVAGVRNALNTIRQLAETERGVKYFSEYIVIPCEIKDEPAMSFRGVHICWFPETPVFEIEKQIRLASYFKFNAVVLESWGVFPYESHPEFCWAEKAVPRCEFKRILALGKELGLTMIPQINLFGHASWARGGSGKHTTLDFHPELQSLFEPDGWSWCLTNPETVSVLKDLVCELHEFFGNPPYFHIGFDEAHDAFSCAVCRKSDIEDVIANHIQTFRDLLADRGARAMMWHDMLLTEGDPRWKGYYAFGNPYTKGLLERIPSDMVICDWEYNYPYDEKEQKEPDWCTSRYFKEKGFDVLVCPWLNTEGTLSFGKMADREKLYGYLMTTWHRNHSNDMVFEYLYGAMAAWMGNNCPPIHPRSSTQAAAAMVRQIVWDMQITEYDRTGNCRYQISPFNTPEVRA